MAELAFVGVGANLGDPPAQMAAGLAALTAAPGVEMVAVSSLYTSPPVGYSQQPDFFNAVVLLRTQVDAPALLRLLHRIEALQHRRREVRWGPRTLDLDLLIFGRQRSTRPELVLPHPRLHQRAFVLVPLVELTPELRHPGTGLPVRAYLRACPRSLAVTRLGRFPSLAPLVNRKDSHGNPPSMHR